jgi:hypothetical protein
MKFLSIVIALNIFVASTGITLYTHICNLSNDVFISVVDMSCDDEGEVKGCCAQKAASCQINPPQSGDDCCESQGAYYKQEITAMLAVHDKTTPELPVLDMPYSFENVSKAVIEKSLTPKSYSLLPAADTGPDLAALQVFRC